MEKYNIEECAALAKTAIEKMRATVRPGAQTGRGSKAAVLRTVREQLRGALQAEYTVSQLVDALREVFGGELTAKTVRAAMREDDAPSAKTTKRPRQRKTTGVAAEPAPANGAPASRSHAHPVGGLSKGPPADPVSPDTDAVPTATGTAAVPTSLPAGVRFTPEQRAEFRIPDWADGSDLGPGEDLAYYGRRKRVAGKPKTPDELKKFIGES